MVLKSYAKAAWDAADSGKEVAPILSRGMMHYCGLIEKAVGAYPSMDECFVVAALEKTAEIIRMLNKDDEQLPQLVELLKSGESTVISGGIVGEVISAE